MNGALIRRASLGKIPAAKFPQDFTGIGIISRSRANIVPVVAPNQSPKKSRYPIPIQIVSVEILISRSHPNDSRGNVCFPVVFRSRAIQSRGIIDFPNPVHTKTVQKKQFLHEQFACYPLAWDHRTGTAKVLL